MDDRDTSPFESFDDGSQILLAAGDTMIRGRLAEFHWSWKIGPVLLLKKTYILHFLLSTMSLPKQSKTSSLNVSQAPNSKTNGSWWSFITRQPTIFAAYVSFIDENDVIRNFLTCFLFFSAPPKIQWTFRKIAAHDP